MEGFIHGGAYFRNSTVGNGRNLLLCQLRCHCNPDHNKLSSSSNTAYPPNGELARRLFEIRLWSQGNTRRGHLGNDFGSVGGVGTSFNDTVMIRSDAISYPESLVFLTKKAEDSG